MGTKAKIQLGDFVRDRITGFEGVATSKTKFITGCTQIGVTPLAVENKTGEGQLFDRDRLEIVRAQEVKDVADKKNPGGPNRDAPKMKL
jgi:hypothetical protein